jgi:N-acetylglucosamine-6-phosphate deacetylase
MPANEPIMSTGEITGRHYRTGDPVRVRWAAGAITEVNSVPASQAAGVESWIAPGLVDVQINGYAGVDYQRDEVTGEDLLRATRALQTDGCTRQLVTLITDEFPRLVARLKRLRQLRSESPELSRGIAGWHIEGPFLSPLPGFHGAHNPAVMCDPSPEKIHELREAAGDDPLLLTMAPERERAIDSIHLATSLGIKVSLGHTDASARMMHVAVAVGATGFTHLGNALPQQIDRHDNVLWRVFDTRGLMSSLIPDTIHVSPALFRLAHRALDPGSICYTTDAMSAAGAPPGRYSIGKLELEVGADQIVRHPGRPNFAGSALRPIDGMLRAAQMLSRPWQEIWDHFSINPATLMGLPSGLEAGSPAELCVISKNMGQPGAELRVYTPTNTTMRQIEIG